MDLFIGSTMLVEMEFLAPFSLRQTLQLALQKCYTEVQKMLLNEVRRSVGRKAKKQVEAPSSTS